MTYYKIIRGKLLPAPVNIEKLIGKPTQKQYLFFGYKPLSDRKSENNSEECTYLEKDAEICVIHR